MTLYPFHVYMSHRVGTEVVERSQLYQQLNFETEKESEELILTIHPPSVSARNCSICSPFVLCVVEPQFIAV